MPDEPTDNDRPDKDRPDTEHEFYDRRSGEDRRSKGERRTTGRRYSRKDVDEDRRSGDDRRSGAPRRRMRDRRRYVDHRYKKHRSSDSRPIYSIDDTARVQRMLSRLGFGVTCPVCEGPFTLGPVDVRGTDTVRQVTCANCGRGTVVTNCILMRVMVVTRILAVRQPLRAILGGAGHEVLEPPHTGAALEIHHENPADVIIIDAFALLQMDGQEFIRVVRHEDPGLRIVVLAPRPSYGMKDPSAVARQLGASHIVRTPFSPQDILRALKDQG